ncbi:MAG: hypothetical protein LBK01_06675 [Burkholderiaceae bacterium]|nr:hypothetical protein [Burkholderiaceae bacterium]
MQSSGKRSAGAWMWLAGMFVSVLCCPVLWAQSPFNQQLKVPPHTLPDAQSDGQNFAPPEGDGILAVYLANRVKEQQVPVSGRRVVARKRGVPPVYAAPHSAPSENNWSVQFKVRNSPVTEPHGNAERNDSVGGVVQGNYRF